MSTFRYKKRLSRRIEWVVFAMCLLVATIFSCGTVYTVQYIESETVQLNLNHTLDVLIQQSLQHQPINPGYATSFYVGTRDGQRLPHWLAHVEDGFNRVSHAGSDWYALSRHQAGKRYVLLQRSNALGRRQNHIYIALFICWAACAVAGLLIGRWLVRMAIHPVTRLAQDVSRIQSTQAPTALAPGYSDDEVGQLAAAFDLAMDRVLALLAREREFTGGVSHELRTPLMVVQGASELLQSTELTSQQQRIVKRIANASAQMEALVSTFLLLARDQHEHSHPLAQAPLGSIVSHIITQLEAGGAAPPGAIVRVGEAPALPVYPATFSGIVLSNLLRNALAYSNAATVDVHLAAGQVSVKDRAPLLGEQTFIQLLAPFQRGDGSSQREGLGLGLAIVKRICDFMGWRLEYRVMDGYNCISVIFDADLTRTLPRREGTD